jgi:hypothetical protein
LTSPWWQTFALIENCPLSLFLWLSRYLGFRERLKNIGVIDGFSVHDRMAEVISAPRCCCDSVVDGCS